MKIALITSERLFEFPPVIALLHTLDRMGHNVVFLTPYQDCDFKSLQLQYARHLFCADTLDERLTRYYSNRIAASAAFHLERMLRRHYIRQIPAKFKKELEAAEVVWVLHENTFLLGGKFFADKLGPYLYTMYELCIKNGQVSKVYDYAARKAMLTVVPEYNRAHIVRAYYALPHMPAIIPNKPIDHPRKKKMPISDQIIAGKVAAIEASGNKLVMYMGILSDERPLEPIIEAVEQLPGYTMAILGGRTPYLDRLEKRMAGRFEYLGSVKPPHHLEIASHADVTYISYVANNHSINAVFCAPNKVYEFAGFGIPMLCNDNPGLKYTVEHCGMGICVPEMTAPEIAKALKHIDANAEAMSAAATCYYESESLEHSVEQALERYVAIRKGGAK